MRKSNSFFFSKILNKNVYDISGSIIGKLNDLIADFNEQKPVVKAIEIRNGRRRSYISSDSLDIFTDSLENYHIKLNTGSIDVMPIRQDEIFLARDFLDKQIVDMNGRKVKRVNDVRLGLINGIWRLVAVDIGLRGLLRRLGLEYFVIRIAGLIKVNFRNALIYWDNVQPLNTGAENLILSTSVTKIKTLHAADIADIIEELDKQSRNRLFQSLDDEKAAEVLEEVETDVQRSLLETLSDEKASDILEIMPSDEAADILEEIDDSRAERLLIQMEAENSDEIRELMKYEENTVGSIMSKEFMSFLPDASISETAAALKVDKPDEEAGHYFYVVNNKKQLLGIFLPLSLVTAGNNTKLYDIMVPSVETLKTDDDIGEALELMLKYNMLYMPVVDERKVLIGIISLHDLVNELVRLRRTVA